MCLTPLRITAKATPAKHKQQVILNRMNLLNFVNYLLTSPLRIIENSVYIK